MFEETTVRLVTDNTAGNTADTNPGPERSHAQTVLDTNLLRVEQLLRQARDFTDEALEIFYLFTTPQHRNLPTLIGQQIEQVIEYRRVKQ